MNASNFRQRSNIQIKDFQNPDNNNIDDTDSELSCAISLSKMSKVTQRIKELKSTSKPTIKIISPEIIKYNIITNNEEVRKIKRNGFNDSQETTKLQSAIQELNKKFNQLEFKYGKLEEKYTSSIKNDLTEEKDLSIIKKDIFEIKRTDLNKLFNKNSTNNNINSSPICLTNPLNKSMTSNKSSNFSFEDKKSFSKSRSKSSMRKNKKYEYSIQSKDMPKQKRDIKDKSIEYNQINHKVKDTKQNPIFSKKNNTDQEIIRSIDLLKSKIFDEFKSYKLQKKSNHNKLDTSITLKSPKKVLKKNISSENIEQSDSRNKANSLIKKYRNEGENSINKKSNLKISNTINSREQIPTESNRPNKNLKSRRSHSKSTFDDTLVSKVSRKSAKSIKSSINQSYKHNSSSNKNVKLRDNLQSNNNIRRIEKSIVKVIKSKNLENRNANISKSNSNKYINQNSKKLMTTTASSTGITKSLKVKKSTSLSKILKNTGSDGNILKQNKNEKQDLVEKKFRIEKLKNKLDELKQKEFVVKSSLKNELNKPI